MTRPQSEPQKPWPEPDWANPPKPGPPMCAGAKVFITREQYQDMGRELVDWASPMSEIPIDGRGHARVECSNEALGQMGVAGRVVYHALCAGCHGVEERNRHALRDASGGT